MVSQRRQLSFTVPATAAFALLAVPLLTVCQGTMRPSPASGAISLSHVGSTIDDGRRVFRYETFGDDLFWTHKARLHEVIEQSVSPTAALTTGLKVDAEAIPADVAAGIRRGTVDLNSPQTTLALLKLDAVVGLKGKVVTEKGRHKLVSIGITCALCHSTVDDSFAKGIGVRQDGWPNRDLDVGAILAMLPGSSEEQKAVYRTWGKGRYDPRFSVDGQNTPLVLPPAYGLAEINNETYTAEGPISYWNAYVAVTQMHGLGNFRDDRLGINIQNSPDQVTPLLPLLKAYQISLLTPPPVPGSYDVAAAERGRIVFEGSCARCHVGGSGTDNNSGVLHGADETGMDPGYAARTTTRAYRTTPLRGLWQHPPYFHDGSAATLADVVHHYERVLRLGLTGAQHADLVEYLKTL